MPGNFEDRHFNSSAVKIKQNITFTHTINHFSKLEKSLNFRLDSEKFPSEAPSQWIMSIYPNGENEPGSFALYLCPVNCDISDTIDCSFTFSILDSSDTETLKKNIDQHTFHNPFYGFGFSHFAFINDVKKLVIMDQLKIRVNIKAQYENKKFFQEEEECGLHFDPKESLVNDLKLLFTCRNYSDCSLPINGSKFEVSKNMLASRSPKLNQIFNKDLSKESSGCQLTDLDRVTGAQFLEFLYTGRVNIADEEIAKKLFVAGHDYARWDLKNLCANYLMKHMNFENVVDVLILADLYQSPEPSENLLKNRAIAYIVKNLGKNYENTELYQNIEKKAQLFPEIMSEVSKSDLFNY